MIVEKNFLSTIFDITNHRHFIAYSLANSYCL